jgi:hypothetical protein
MRKPDSDPVGCETLFPGSEYSCDEADYLRRVEAYRVRKGRRFLTALDYREMFRSWGWTEPVLPQKQGP